MTSTETIEPGEVISVEFPYRPKSHGAGAHVGIHVGFQVKAKQSWLGNLLYRVDLVKGTPFGGMRGFFRRVIGNRKEANKFMSHFLEKPTFFDRLRGSMAMIPQFTTTAYTVVPADKSQERERLRH